jgi:S-adenosyl-L-methionine hydrolase (adenosine-forming)
MTTNSLLTLLSDFGWNDTYVGVMKGVIAQINPNVRVIDLTHDVPPQNIMVAQFNLVSAYPYFPSGTVHVAVVDPGVGSSRRAIAIELETGFLVGPDNGIFTNLLTQQRVIHSVELTNRHYWRVPEPSHTFHGRDIFAPVAAHLASGVPITKLGDPIEAADLAQCPIAACVPTEHGFVGHIQHIDRFGNVITTIPGDCVSNKRWSVIIGKRTLPGCSTYSDVSPGEPLALIGSHGWVELAISGGDAHFQLRLNWDDVVQVVIEKDEG